jgi:transcriptional regulator with XRE-family HTH domain
MRALSERIRYARVLSGTSQAALADAVGVQRSAVAQWERKDGSHPSMQHLVDIAATTGVCMEWLGTGRGPVLPEPQAWTQTMRVDDYARDDIEAQCLMGLRKLPLQLRKQIASMISLVAKNF